MKEGGLSNVVYATALATSSRGQPMHQSANMPLSSPLSIDLGQAISPCHDDVPGGRKPRERHTHTRAR